jgi:hypothetical protein
MVPVPPALQELHEQAHPDGTLYIEYCREPACREMLRAYGAAASSCP